MNLRESARFAVRGVLANKMRSALTTLGILIGVAAVIILIAVGTGSSRAVEERISALGSSTLTVTPLQGGTGGRTRQGGGPVFAGPGGIGLGGGAGGGGARAGMPAPRPQTDTGTQTREPLLTLDDAYALVDPVLAPDIVSVAPVVSAQSVSATLNGASHVVATFNGTTPSYLANNNDSVQAGTVFTESDYTQRRRVALLGPTVAQNLVGGDGLSAVGQTVTFNGVGYEVIGVLTAKGSTGPQNQDDRVLAPLTSVQDTLSGYGPLSSISVKTASARTVPAATAEVTTILNARHDVTAADQDYTINSPSSIQEAATANAWTFTVLLGSVAALSLLVGGIGVMNIMLVTVTERTREIGIRKAIGAQKPDIIAQFLIEAVLLSVFGGVLGIGVGLVGSQFPIIGVLPVVAPYSVALAFAVAVATGLFFGLYPANRAASLRPIDALRYE